tara:strand:- start:456 stop:1493 length:1038 start_codon:yes stop_codon:yes gene_type:complete
MKYYIGLDAHAATSTGVVIDQEGKIIFRETFETTEGNLWHFIERVQGERNLTFEESHLSQWLYVTLKDKVEKLVVCNPVYLAKKPGAKTDFRDALHLAQELRCGHVQAVHHEQSAWIELRMLVSGYLDLVSQIAACKNRLKALFRMEAIKTSESKFYKNRNRIKEIANEQSRFAANSFYEQIDFLEREKQTYKIEFQRNKTRYRPIRNLMSIPGIDLIRANIIAAVVCTPHRFKNKHQFWGYCMLVRHIQASGGRIYGNKRVHGRGELRNVFIGAAESALRSKTALRDHYEARRAMGLSHKAAKLSLARKIASLSLSLLKNNETYQDDFEQRLSERIAIRKTLNL